jgi:endonuclease-3 related protein
VSPSKHSRKKIHSIYKKLHHAYGGQGWWPGDTPFEVMVGAILTQNTAWMNVEKAIANLKSEKKLSAKKIVETRHGILAKILKPSGYFNLKATRLKNFCEWYLDQGEIKSLAQKDTEELRKGLLSVNGIGCETADDILLYAFDRPIFVIDAYTRRIFSRLGLIEGDEPYEQLRAFFEEAIVDARRENDNALFNEYHALIVVHGKDICRVRPKCEQCMIKQDCSF